MVLGVHVCVALGDSTNLLLCKEVWRAFVADIRHVFHGLLYSLVPLALRHESDVCRDSTVEDHVPMATSRHVCPLFCPGPGQESGRVECALQQPCYDMDFGDHLRSLHCPDTDFGWLSIDL